MANPVLTNGVGSPQSIFEVSNTEQHPIGTRGVLEDRAFRYGLHVQATAIGPNTLAAAAAPIANHTTETGAITAQPSGAVAGTTSIVGAEAVKIALGATLAGQDEYKNGYLKIESATTGAGQFFKLRNFPYTAASGTTDVIGLYDPVVTDTTGTVTWSLVHNPWAYIIQSPVTTIVSMSVGVPLVNFAAPATASTATAGYLRTGTATWSKPNYGWFQTWGPCSLLNDTSNLVVGSGLITSAVAASSGVAVETDIKQRIGIAMETITTDTIYASVFLQIAP